MPVRQVGRDCYQWGNQKKYCGPNAKKKAILQGIAIENTGWKEAEDDYTKTYGEQQGTIRRKLKNKIMKQAIMGTKAGQWSARKSQELKRQYEEACEKKSLAPYKGKKTSAQKDLT